MSISRRNLLTSAIATSVGFSALAARGQANAQDRTGTPTVDRGYVNEVEGYGRLVEDPAGIIDLPTGFSYKLFSARGDTMDDGLLVPGKHDGMAAFRHADPDKVTLVRNHEVSHKVLDRSPFGADYALLDKADRNRVFDFRLDGKPLSGGTTTMIYNVKTQRLEEHYLSLTGTSTNCAGGATPWGAWLSCEETVQKAGDIVTQSHGYIFEVPSAHKGLVEPVPLKAMGRFKHEAAAVDPRTGIVYLTEDQIDGLFYRFLPAARGELHKGGKLQALAIREMPSAFTGNKRFRLWNPGQGFHADWVDLTDPDSPEDSLRHDGHKAGAAQFVRAEGIHFGNGELYFACTAGGAKGFGQIMRYIPSRFEGQPGERREPGRIELFIESTDERVMDYADNLTLSPWGHMYVCEDRYSNILINHLKIVTPQGKVATFAANRTKNNAEWAGVTFSPDGSTLFANIQEPGVTVAVTGPWATFSDTLLAG